MRMLKVLGTSTLISGTAFLATYLYNQARWEKEKQLWWTKEMVRQYSPDKYNELKAANIEDLKVWREAEYALRDSVEHSRRVGNDAQKSYFEGGKLYRECCK